jgi:hypothetical protein
MAVVKKHPISLIFGLAALAVRTAAQTAVGAVVTGRNGCTGQGNAS